MQFTIGDRVRYSCYALRSLRDGYLEEGSPSRKETKKAWFEAKRAEFGTVTDIRDYGYCIRWDNGSESQTASNLVTSIDCPLVNPKPVTSVEKPKRKPRATKGQIPKDQIPGLLRQLTAWESDNRTWIETMKPEFKAWIHSQLVEIMRMVESQDYFSAVQSRIRHMITQAKRMQSGEIASVSEDGTVFTLAPINTL